MVSHMYFDTELGVVTFAPIPFAEPVGGAPVRYIPITVPMPVGNDWQWNGESWVQEVPQPVEPLVFPDLPARQFWLAALSVGITEDSLVEAISDPSSSSYIPDPVARQEAIIDIRKATSFSRSYPTLNQLATAQGIPAEQLDALWMWATTI